MQKITVFVELLDEGTETYIKTYAKQLQNGNYEILKPPYYDKEDQLWDFLPDDEVALKEPVEYLGTTLPVATHPDPHAVRIMMPSTEEYTPPWREAYAVDLGDGRYEVQATPL